MESKIVGGKPKPKALFKVFNSNRTISAVTKVSGGYKITSDATNCYVGQIFRSNTAAHSMYNIEYEIVGIEDTNKIIIASEYPYEPEIGNTFNIYQAITPRVAADGSAVIDLATTDLATETTLQEIAADMDSAQVEIQRVSEAIHDEIDVASRGMMIGGKSGTQFYMMAVDANGNPQVDVLTSPQVVAQGSTTAGQVGSLIQAAVTTAAPSYSTGQTSPLSQTTGGALRVQVDNSPTVLTRPSPTSSSSSAMATAESTAYATNLVVKASAGRLYAISGYNSHTSDQFIQIHNTASLPADASVPKRIIRVYADSNFYIDFGDYGLYCSTGITLCNSTTGPTKTIGAANVWFQADYT